MSCRIAKYEFDVSATRLGRVSVAVSKSCERGVARLHRALLLVGPTSVRPRFEKF